MRHLKGMQTNLKSYDHPFQQRKYEDATITSICLICHDILVKVKVKSIRLGAPVALKRRTDK